MVGWQTGVPKDVIARVVGQFQLWEQAMPAMLSSNSAILLILADEMEMMKCKPSDYDPAFDVRVRCADIRFEVVPATDINDDQSAFDAVSRFLLTYFVDASSLAIEPVVAS